MLWGKGKGKEDGKGIVITGTLSSLFPLLLHQWLPTRGSVWNSPKRINNAVQFSKEGTKNYICNYNKRKKIIRKYRRILLRLANLCLPRNPTYLDGGRRRRSWAKKRGRRWGYGGSRGGRKGLFDFGGGNEAKRRPRKMDSEDGERKKEEEEDWVDWLLHWLRIYGADGGK